jgi:hypothetical protein
VHTSNGIFFGDDFHANPGQELLISDLFSVADFEQAPLQYFVRQSSASPDGGYFLVDGARQYQNGSTWLSVNPNDRYVASSATSLEYLDMMVDDGQGFVSPMASEAIYVGTFQDTGGDFGSARPVQVGTTPQKFTETVGVSYKDDIVDGGDFYQLVVSAPTTLQLDLYGQSQFADLWLYNGSQQQLAHSLRDGTTPQHIAADVDAGTYYARITGGRNTEYTLAVSSGS